MMTPAPPAPINAANPKDPPQAPAAARPAYGILRPIDTSNPYEP